MILRTAFIILALCISPFVHAQNQDLSVLSLEEFLGYVKKYHPVVKQANLILNEGELELMRARGAFDPKLEVDHQRKEFKSINYYNQLNTTFKIPTWYGIELKANFEDNSGVFLNPENILPQDGLYNLGVSIPLAKGLLINRRMANLKQAKLFKEQTIAQRQLRVNEILTEASVTYFNWLKAYKDQQVYETFLENAKVRLNGIQKSYRSGDRPAIDTLEAGIMVNTRKLALEKAQIVLIKSRLAVSNFMWLENNIPVELEEIVKPDLQTGNSIDAVLNISPITLESTDIEKHPKLKTLDLKYGSQKIERNLKRNNLLPQINLEYNFLSTAPQSIRSFNPMNYKSGLRIHFPLFLRKERGDLKLSDLKLTAIELDISNTKIALQNKLRALLNELTSYKKQIDLAIVIVEDYSGLLQAEERKFMLGESSVLVVNLRESKFIEAQLKAIETENQYLGIKASVFGFTNWQ